MVQASTIIAGRYVLVNPMTGRTCAYLTSTGARVEFAQLVGKYLGVRGEVRQMEGSDIVVIDVHDATLMPTPK